jgi:hypothetical protein
MSCLEAVVFLAVVGLVWLVGTVRGWHRLLTLSRQKSGSPGGSGGSGSFIGRMYRGS